MIRTLSLCRGWLDKSVPDRFCRFLLGPIRSRCHSGLWKGGCRSAGCTEWPQGSKGHSACHRRRLHQWTPPLPLEPCTQLSHTERGQNHMKSSHWQINYVSVCIWLIQVCSVTGVVSSGVVMGVHALLSFTPLPKSKSQIFTGDTWVRQRRKNITTPFKSSESFVLLRAPCLLHHLLTWSVYSQRMFSSLRSLWAMPVGKHIVIVRQWKSKSSVWTLVQ